MNVLKFTKDRKRNTNTSSIILTFFELSFNFLQDQDLKTRFTDLMRIFIITLNKTVTMAELTIQSKIYFRFKILIYRDPSAN